MVTAPAITSATDAMLRQTGPMLLRRSATEILATSSVNGRRRTAGTGSPFPGDGHILGDAHLDNRSPTTDKVGS